VNNGAALREWLRAYFAEIPLMEGIADDLAAGREVHVHRYELPDDHPERRGGPLHDHLVLGSDDVLHPLPTPRSNR
jgi:hypothetical protein